MNDISQMKTHRFTDEQRRAATHALREIEEDEHSKETEKTPTPALGREDVIARLNALLRYVPALKCYAVLQNKVYIQIEEMALTPNGQHVHCLLYGEREKGTAVTVPFSGPFLIYIDNT